MRRLIIMLQLVLLMLVTGSVHASNFPTKGVRILVPYPPGGGTDQLARLVGQKLSQKWGQSVVIENRPGGNGIISTGMLARAPADGYTIGFILSTHTLNPFLNLSLPYNTEKDFAPVIHLTNVPGLLVINNMVPADNLTEFIKLVKAQPEKFNYGSPGTSTAGHLSSELFKKQAGVNITHVPFQGGAPSTFAILQNTVQMVIGGPPPLLPHLQSGKLKVLGVTSKKRSAVLPNIPTLAEQGITDFDMYEWYGIVAPAGTPDAIITSLNRSIAEVLRDAEVVKVLRDQAADIVGGTSEEFSEFIRDQIRKSKAIVEATAFTGR